MRTFLLVAAAVSVGLVGCDKRAQSDAEERKQQELREADERRIAELRDLEQRAANRKAEEEAAEWQRQRDELAAERTKLERDRAQMESAQARAAADARLAEIREEERRNAEREAERKMEARRLAEERAAQNAERERREQSIDFFYDALEPYGDWVELERYGYCWQPRNAANPGWRPYLAGNWARTDYGWTWVSREPFGWATYHYGRWIRLRRLGWVWVPGSEWAPAWVSWRRGDRYVGWAPLPPEARSNRGFTAAVDRDYDIGPAHYNFVPKDMLAEETYEGKALAPEQNITVIQQTVNVTNITVQNVKNRTVVYNEGPKLVDQGVANKVRRLEIERVEKTNKAPAPAEQRGNVLQVVAPVIAPRDQKPARPPAKVRERFKGMEVERGWTGTDEGKVAEVKEQQKKEAREVEQSNRSTQPQVPERTTEAKPPTVPPREDPSPAATPPAENPRQPSQSKPATESTGAVPKQAAPAAPATPADAKERPVPKESPKPADRRTEPLPASPLRPDRRERPERPRPTESPAAVPKKEDGAPIRERSRAERGNADSAAGGLRKPDPAPAATGRDDRKPAEAASTTTPAPKNPPNPAPGSDPNAKPGSGAPGRPGESVLPSPARPIPPDEKDETGKEKAGKAQQGRNRERERNRPGRAPQPASEESAATPPAAKPTKPEAAPAPAPGPAPATESSLREGGAGPEKADAEQTSESGMESTENVEGSKVSNRTRKTKPSKEKPAKASRNPAEERRKE